MELFGILAEVFVLLLAASGLSLCLFSFKIYGHRGALWWGLALAGLALFVLELITDQISTLIRAAGGSSPPGLGLLLSALAAVLTVLALPRFVLALFGQSPGRLLSSALWSLTALMSLLSLFVVLRGWGGFEGIPGWALLALRVLLFGSVGLSGLATALFQARLPDRRLARQLALSLVVLLFLLPLIILETTGAIEFPGIPNLGLILLLAFLSTGGLFYAARSFLRPSFMEGGRPSAYFAQRFGLSERQLDMVEGVLDGLGNKEMGERFHISPKTVENHLYQIYQKTGVRSRIQLYNLLRAEGGVEGGSGRPAQSRNEGLPPAE